MSQKELSIENQVTKRSSFTKNLFNQVILNILTENIKEDLPGIPPAKTASNAGGVGSILIRELRYYMPHGQKLKVKLNF